MSSNVIQQTRGADRAFGLMLAHRLRCWLCIGPMLARHISVGGLVVKVDIQ